MDSGSESMKFIKQGHQMTSNIFNQLEEKKKEIIAQGGDVINLSIGTPDFQPDLHVRQAVSRAALDSASYKYSLEDMPALQQSVIGWYERRYGVALERKEITSVSGSQEGIAHIGFSICRHGNLILAPDPGYPIFTFGPMLAGAEIGLVPLQAENNYLIDFDKIDTAVADKARAIVVSYPNNPTTAIADAAFYERLVAFARKHDIIVIHDNAYSDLMLNGASGMSFLSIPGAKEVGIEFNSLSKTYNLTGMRVSFALGNSDVIEKFRSFRSQIDYGMFYPAQIGAIAALDGAQDIIVRNREGYAARRDALCGGLRSIGWDVPDTQATMFVWAKIPSGYSSSALFAMKLMQETGVICVPGESFGELGQGYVRFALVVSAERMTKAVKRIENSTILKGNS